MHALQHSLVQQSTLVHPQVDCTHYPIYIEKFYFHLKADTEYIILVLDLFVFQVSYVVPFVQCYSKCHFYNHHPSKARGFVSL